MNAAELAVHIAAESGITVALATHLLNDLASAAIGELQAGKQVTLPGIGVLKPELQPQRCHMTGPIKARIVVRLLPAADLKYALACAATPQR